MCYVTIKCSRVSRNGTRSFGKRLKSEQIKSTDKKSNFSVETYGITWKFQRAACLFFLLLPSSPLSLSLRPDRLVFDSWFYPAVRRRVVVGIDFSSLVLTSSALRMHRFPGYALKVSFIALLGPGAAIYFPAHICDRRQFEPRIRDHSPATRSIFEIPSPRPAPKCTPV